MKVGFVGLGRMGANMAVRLLRGGHQVVGQSLQYDPSLGVEQAGGVLVPDLKALVGALPSPRVIWMMVPAGAPIDSTITTLLPMLSKGDVVVDGGNSYFHDTVRRGKTLAEAGVAYVDVGTSGGVWGLEKGYCMMVGGDKGAFATIEPLLRTLSSEDSYLHVGASGAGHYVKMIHNGIEYGMMQAYAEGFDVLSESSYDFNLPEIASLWNNGAVIRSWLLELASKMLKEDGRLDKLMGVVQDSGTGRWTVEEAMRLSVPTPVITASLQSRFRSRRENTFTDRFLAALRNQFGGHDVVKK